MGSMGAGFGGGKRGSSGGTPSYGTQGGYGQSKPADSSGCAIALPLVPVFLLVALIRKARKR